MAVWSPECSNYKGRKAILCHLLFTNALFYETYSLEMKRCLQIYIYIILVMQTPSKRHLKGSAGLTCITIGVKTPACYFCILALYKSMLKVKIQIEMQCCIS